MVFSLRHFSRMGIRHCVLMALAMLVGYACPANAGNPNLLTNPGFETTSFGATTGYVCTTNPTSGGGTCASAVTGWGVNGDGGGNASTQTTPFAPQSSWNDHPSSYTAWVVLPGTNTFNNGFGFTTQPGVSPNGGNYIALDGDPTYASSIWQTINGLSVGAQYTLTFWQAAAQQGGTTGATTERWSVSFGSSTQLSTIMNNASGGTVAWNQQTMTFTATATTQTLNFFSVGTPAGQPPVVLLDGVSLIAVPEPVSAALLGTGILALAARKKKQIKAA